MWVGEGGRDTCSDSVRVGACVKEESEEVCGGWEVGRVVGQERVNK